LLDAADFENLHELEDQDVEQQLAKNPGKCSWTMLIIYAFSLYFILLDAFLKLNTYDLIPLVLGFVDE
jgi:hypothetical protein